MDEDRVAVRLGFGHGADAHCSTAARPVFNDEGLADLGRDVLEHRSWEEVGGALPGENGTMTWTLFVGQV
jgi:hypothetical protein